MNTHCTIRIEQGRCVTPDGAMAEPFDFELLDGEHIALAGPNAGGKSRLTDLILGRRRMQYPWPRFDFGPQRNAMACDNISYVTFRDSYGEADGGYYPTQRWNVAETDVHIDTAGQLLDRAYRAKGGETAERAAWREELYTLFGMHALLAKPIVALSSGELRKFALVRTLFAAPRVLVMDNPYIGLDAPTRLQLTDLLTRLSRRSGLQIVLLVSRAADVPPFITHVYEVADLRVGPKRTREEYLAAITPSPIAAMPTQPSPNEARAEVISLRDVSIRYGKHTLLSHLSWTVCEGERWALRGRNGSGKSTLLSLVCADNPQSYACDISLFGKRRGSGESIWDIKRRIGYVSPELHRAYRRNVPAVRIVASGLSAYTGLYVSPSEADLAAARECLGRFGLSDGQADRSFLHLSSGEQRLVLLARAFVKDPDLLVLDEPMHGLDEANRRLVMRLIGDYCSRPDKTLVMVTHYDDELPPCITHRLELEAPHD